MPFPPHPSSTPAEFHPAGESGALGRRRAACFPSSQMGTPRISQAGAESPETLMGRELVGLSQGPIRPQWTLPFGLVPAAIRTSRANRVKRRLWVILGEVHSRLVSTGAAEAGARWGWRHDRRGVRSSPGAGSQGQIELGTSGSPGFPGLVSLTSQRAPGAPPGSCAVAATEQGGCWSVGSIMTG